MHSLLRSIFIYEMRTWRRASWHVIHSMLVHLYAFMWYGSFRTWRQASWHVI
jgi:hypothetical protein